MKKYKLSYLENDLLENFNDLQYGALSSEAYIEVFEAGESIIRFDKEIDALRYLLKGKAKITLIHETGKRSIVHFVKPEEYIGELTFIDIEPQHKDVTAICECICVSVPMYRAKEVLVSDAAFLMDLNRYVGSKLLKRTYFSSKNQNYELKHRLAAYILLCQNDGFYKEKHTETAEFLGVSYRHLLHTFKNLVDNQCLVKSGRGYKLDIEKLRTYSIDIEI